MRRQMLALLLIVCLAGGVFGQSQPRRRDPKPGFNLFSVENDIQLGAEAKAEIEKQMQVVDDRAINDFIRSIGAKLTAQPQAGKYPYSFQVVNQKTINAFALPGGPMFIHSALIQAADNEAQIAGVMAHEISHVALRHGTNQASKANLIQLPAMLAGALAGGSMLGKLAQAGIGLGANSVLLKYSRSAESDADLVGTRIMAGAGYNPVEMARFFEKLEAEGGQSGGVAQFFSDHPNPANRKKAIEEEVQYLPKRNYVTDTGRLAGVKAVVAKLPEPPKPRVIQAQPGGGPPPEIRPAERMKQYRGRGFSISYPENWEALDSQQSSSVTIAPREGLVRGQGDNISVGCGVIIEVYTPGSGTVDLARDTDDLVRQLSESNSGMRVTRAARAAAAVTGRRSMTVTLASPSPYRGQEVDRLVTVDRGRDVLYLVFVAPEADAPRLDATFDQMLQSLQVAN